MPLRNFYVPVSALFVLCSVVACSSHPVMMAPASVIGALPHQVAASPEQYLDRDVLWGGRILDVYNRIDNTEVTILAYPLDAGQRPQPQAPTQGRFIAVLPGYVEGHDYPEGLFVTLVGRLDGQRVGKVQEHDYVYPLVRAEHVHLWPPGYQFDQPRLRVGIGVGIGIH